MRFIRTLMFILRLFFGVTYILSGFFKLTDPVGTGLIVEEYLNAMHLGFLRFGAVPFGMVLSLVEFLIGISVLMCVRMRAASVAGLAMTAFFTVLTFFMALSGAVHECGCFGQAIHLSMWETFIKNVVLMLCIVPVFMFRKKFKPVAPVKAEWVFLSIYGILALFCTVFSYVNVPMIEFGDFKAGSNLSMKLDRLTDSDNFKTVFVYERDGVSETFGIDNLPDTSWTYVSSETEYLGDPYDLLFDMTLSDADGNTVTDAIVNSRTPVFIFVALRPSSLKDRYWDKVAECADSISVYGGRTYVAVPVMDAEVDRIVAGHPTLGAMLVSGDYKTLISMVRSNGGVIFIEDGIVVRKWAGWKFDPKDVSRIFSMDSEELTARETISQRLFYESSILLLFLIIIIFRYVCGIVYGKKKAV